MSRQTRTLYWRNIVLVPVKLPELFQRYLLRVAVKEGDIDRAG